MMVIMIASTPSLNASSLFLFTKIPALKESISGCSLHPLYQKQKMSITGKNRTLYLRR
jgi:hypothetical protein